MSSAQPAHEVALPAAVGQVISTNRFTVVGFDSSLANEILACIWDAGGFARAQERLPDSTDPSDLIIVDSSAVEGAALPNHRPIIVVGGPARLAALAIGPSADFMIAPVHSAELLLRCHSLLTRRNNGMTHSFRRGDRPARPARVLVGASDPVVIALLEVTFEHFGMECKVVTAGDQVLAHAVGWTPDSIVLTMNLPETNGFDVLECLKRDLRTAPISVMFLTPDQQERNVLRAFALGAGDLVTTPFSPLELVARLKRLQADY